MKENKKLSSSLQSINRNKTGIHISSIQSDQYIINTFQRAMSFGNSVSMRRPSVWEEEAGKLLRRIMVNWAFKSD